LKLKYDELLSSFAFNFNLRRYGSGWKPVVPTTAMVGDRYGQVYGADDPLTTRVGIDPTVRRCRSTR